MAISDLTRLVKPPAVPNQVGTMADWQAVERELGLTLPPDYRDYVFTYGTGSLGQFYWIWNPFWGSAFVGHLRQVCDYERESQQEFPENFPYPIYPKCPGALPWASDGNGNYYCWLTEGPPESWPVLTNEVRGDGYVLHRCTMTEYLAGVLRGHIKPLASGYPSPEDLIFQGEVVPPGSVFVSSIDPS